MAQNQSASRRASNGSASARISEIDRKVRTASRSHPFIAVGGAVLFGYLVGRIATRV